MKHKTVIIDGKPHYIDISEPSDDKIAASLFIFLGIVGIIAGIYFALHMPSGKDFDSKEYADKAVNMALPTVQQTENQFWLSKGYITGWNYGIEEARQGKTKFDFDTCPLKPTHDEDGLYTINYYNKINTSLVNSTNATKSVSKYYKREYVATVKFTPKRNGLTVDTSDWKVIEVKSLDLIEISKDEYDNIGLINMSYYGIPNAYRKAK